MADWQSIGTLQPDFYQWRRFPSALGPGSLFRARQEWDGTYPSGRYDPERDYLLVTVVTETGERGELWPLYPQETNRLFSWPEEPELIARGYSARFVEVRSSSFNRFHERANWRLTLERWAGPIVAPEVLPPDLAVLKFVY